MGKKRHKTKVKKTTSQQRFTDVMSSYGYYMLDTGVIERAYVIDRHYGRMPRGFVVYRTNGVATDHQADNLVAFPKTVLGLLKQAQAASQIRFTSDQARQIAQAADDKVSEYVAVNQERLRQVNAKVDRRDLVMNRFQKQLHQLRRQIFDNYAAKWTIAQLALKAPKQEVKVPDYFSGKGEVTKVQKPKKTVTVWRIKQGDVEGAVREVAL